MTPTVPADVPTTGPNAKADERPPVMPIAATKHSAAGAKAFAKFFLQTIDWGYATTSSTYMRRYFQSSCRVCVIVRNSLDNTKRAGGHFAGGRVTVTDTSNAHATAVKSADFVVAVIVDITASERISRGGSASNPDVAYAAYREHVSVKWIDNAWSAVLVKGSDS